MHWLWILPAGLILAAAAYLLEALVGFVQFLAWLILVPLWMVEQAAALVVGSVLWVLRVTGAARSRVDVIGWWAWSSKKMRSSTVILVRGRGAASALVRALAAEREASCDPFDPAGDQVERLLAGAGATVARHASTSNAGRVSSPLSS